ncbi:MAG TPA: hypothetical protein VJL84_06570 [Kiloniellales bacterium]|nr:hypothetical protein [Kiloniellales bacterium]
MKSVRPRGADHGLGQARPESFERYYLRQVAMGEGCNCAEQVLSQREQKPLRSSGLRDALRALLRTLGR